VRADESNSASLLLADELDSAPSRDMTLVEKGRCALQTGRQ